MAINDHVFTKLEIARYLRNYTFMFWNATAKKDVSFGNILSYVVDSDDELLNQTKNYYGEMIQVYQFMCLTKYLSVMKDSFFDYIKDEQLNKLDIFDDIFINESDKNKFSKKQTIKFIRNAVCHNDNPTHDLYSLKRKDGEVKLEINLLNTKPVPFNVELNMEQYFKIAQSLAKANKINAITLGTTENIDFNGDLCNQIINNAYFRKYYIQGKDEDETQRFFEKTVNKGNKYLEKYFDYKNYNFSYGQASTITNNVYEWGRLGIDPKDSLPYSMINAIPLSETKFHSLMINSAFNSKYVSNPDLSILDVEKDAKNFAKSIGDKNNYYLYLIDFDNHLATVFSIYMGYMLDSVITDENINTGKEVYPREKLRNSFVHLRWYPALAPYIKLFDWDYGDKNELKPNWEKSINASELLHCVDDYFEKSMQKENKSYKLRSVFLVKGVEIEKSID